MVVVVLVVVGGGAFCFTFTTFTQTLSLSLGLVVKIPFTLSRCADDHLCPNGEVTSVPGCENIEQGLMDADTVCHFCCTGRNCNKPPALFPYN